MKRTRRTLNWITDRKRIMYATLCPLCRWQYSDASFHCVFGFIRQIRSLSYNWILSNYCNFWYTTVNGWHQLIRSHISARIIMNTGHIMSTSRKRSVHFKMCQLYTALPPLKRMPWRLLKLFQYAQS